MTEQAQGYECVSCGGRTSDADDLAEGICEDCLDAAAEYGEEADG